MNKHRPDNPEWRTAWKNILEHHNKAFVQSWFCFQFPLHIKAPKQSMPTPKQEQKLHRKVIRELTRKIKDIECYLTESLKDFNKAKRHREKQAQRRAQNASDNKQDEDRERFRQQAEAETAATYSTSKDMTPANKAL